MKHTSTPESLAARFNCTPAQIRAQFARNATQLSAMAGRAGKVGRKVNGYTVEQLRAMAEKARENASL